MDESRWMLFCLAVLALCGVVVTGLALSLMGDVRRTLGCWQAMATECQATAKDARRMLHRVHRLLTAGDHIVAQVEETVHRVCVAAEDVTGRVLGVRDRLQAFVTRLRGNHRTGAGSRPTNRRAG